MPQFKHALFVSYRHGQLPIKQAFIKQFKSGLESELELLRSEKIYVDTERLKGGASIPRRWRVRFMTAQRWSSCTSRATSTSITRIVPANTEPCAHLNANDC